MKSKTAREEIARHSPHFEEGIADQNDNVPRLAACKSTAHKQLRQ